MFTSEDLHNMASAQNSYFSAHQGYINSLGAGIPGRSGATYQTGMMGPPAMAGPQYQSFRTAMSDMSVQRSPLPGIMSPGSMRLAARERMNQLPGDILSGGVYGAAEATSMAADIGSFSLISGGLSAAGVGGVAAFAGGMGMGIPAAYAAKEAISPYTSGLKWGVENRAMAKRMQRETRNDPTMRRLGMDLSDFTDISESMRSTAIEGSEEGYDMERVMNVGSIGMQGGQFDLSQNAGEFKSKFKKYIESVKDISKVVKVSFEEGAQMMNELKQMGFFDIDAQLEQMQGVAGMANMSGMSTGQAMQIMRAGGGAHGLGRGALGATGRLTALSGTGGEAARLVSSMGGAGRAGVQLMKSSQSYLGSTGFGMAMLGAEETGSGFGVNLDTLSAGLQDTQIAKLMTGEGRSEITSELGGASPYAILQNIQKAARRSGMSEEQLNDPHTLSILTQGRFKPSQIKAIQKEMGTIGTSDDVFRQEIQAKFSGGFSPEHKPSFSLGEWTGVNQWFRNRGKEQDYTSEVIAKKTSDWIEKTSAPIQAFMGKHITGTYYQAESTGGLATIEDLDKRSEIMKKAFSTDKGSEAIVKEAVEDIEGLASEKKTFLGETTSNMLSDSFGWLVGEDRINDLLEYESDLGSDKLKKVLEGGSENSKMLRQAAQKYAKEGDPVNLKKIKNALLESGMDRENVNKITSKIKKNPSSLSDIMTKYKLSETVEASKGIKGQITQLVRNPDIEMDQSTRRAFRQFSKRGGMESFRTLYEDVQTMSDEQLESLRKEGGAMGQLLAEGAVQGTGADELYETATSGMSIKEGQTVTSGSKYEGGQIDIASAAKVIINTKEESIYKVEPEQSKIVAMGK